MLALIEDETAFIPPQRVLCASIRAGRLSGAVLLADIHAGVYIGDLSANLRERI